MKTKPGIAEFLTASRWDAGKNAYPGFLHTIASLLPVGSRK
jgi:hypothetical protein